MQHSILVKSLANYLDMHDSYNLLTLNNETYDNIDIFYNNLVVDCDKLAIPHNLINILSKIKTVKNPNYLIKYMPHSDNYNNNALYQNLKEMREEIFIMKINDIYPFTQNLLNEFDKVMELYITTIDANPDAKYFASVLILNMFLGNIYLRIPKNDNLFCKLQNIYENFYTITDKIWINMNKTYPNITPIKDLAYNTLDTILKNTEL